VRIENAALLRRRHHGAGSGGSFAEAGFAAVLNGAFSVTRVGGLAAAAAGAAGTLAS
jgi:hypothetical protein